MSSDSVLALKIALYSVGVRFGWSIVSLFVTGVAMRYGFKPLLRWLGFGAMLDELQGVKQQPPPPKERFYVEVSAPQFDQAHDDRFQHSHVTRRGWISHHMASAWMFVEDATADHERRVWLLDMSTPLRVLEPPAAASVSEEA